MSGIKRFFSFLLKLILALVIILVLLLAAMFVIPLLEKADDTIVAGSADWMADVPDDWPLSAIVIPGTHDSATQYVQLAFFSKCQALSVSEQLAAGYRYLDIRLGADGERLKLMHGFTNCKEGPLPWDKTLYLESVIDQCAGFLAAHPTECILFAVKQEHGEESTEEFAALLDSAFQPYSEYLLETDTIPLLSEARGKIVLFRRYGEADGSGTPAGIPLLWKNQDGTAFITPTYEDADNFSYTLRVQDRYEYDIETKWAAFNEGLGGGDLCLDFLSTKGKLAYGHPYWFARTLNKRLLQADLRKAESGAVIIVDFADAVLAEKIYRENR